MVARSRGSYQDSTTQIYYDNSGLLTIAAFEDCVFGVYEKSPTAKNTVACPVCGGKLTWRSGDRVDAVRFTCYADTSKKHQSEIRKAVEERLGLPSRGVSSNGASPAGKPRSKKEITAQESKRAAENALRRDFELEMQVLQWVNDAEAEGWTYARTKRLLIEYLRHLNLVEHLANYEELLIETWTVKFKERPPLLERKSTASKCAKEFGQHVAGYLIYCLKRRLWIGYGLGVSSRSFWRQLADEEVFGIVQMWLESQGVEPSSALVRGVMDLTRIGLSVEEFEADPDLLSFSNGVYRLSDNAFLESAPQHRVDYQIPRPYVDCEGDWSPISRWLETSLNHDAVMIERVYCLCASILRGYFSPGGPHYAELIGQSGGGKGTLIRLLRKLLGKQNTKSMTLYDLETNSFSLQGLDAGIRLVVFPDEDQYRGATNRFFQLTGDDPVSVNRKNQTIVDVDYSNWVVIASTQPVFAGKASEKGTKRRRLPIQGWRRVKEIVEIESEFTEPVLVAFTQFLLSIPLKRIDKAIVGTAFNADDEVELDPLLGWFNDRILVQEVGKDLDGNPVAVTTASCWQSTLGSDKRRTDQLFGNYCEYCEATNISPRGFQVFSRDLRTAIERIVSEKDWKQVEVKKTKVGVIVTGVRLRSAEDHGYDRPLDKPSDR